MTSLRANTFLLLAALFWGTGNVPQKTVLSELGPFTAVGMRCFIGMIVVLPFVWREVARAERLNSRDLRGMLEVALLFAAAIACQQVAYTTTTVTNASFLVSMSTVITPLIVWLLSKTSPTPVVWAAVAAGLSGAMLMSGGAMSSFATGDFVCLASAAIYSLWFVRLGVLVTRTGRPGLVTVGQFALASFLCLSVGMGVEPLSPANLTAALPDLLLLGVIGTGLPYGLQAIAQQHATANTAAILTSAESVFGAAAAAVFLGEWLTPAMWLGAALVLTAILAVQLSTSWFPKQGKVQAS